MEEESLVNVKDPVNIKCLWFSFGPLIQKELLNTRREWNEHCSQYIKDIL